MTAPVQNPAPEGALSPFEIPSAFIGPSLQVLRGFNTALDLLFYDVPGLARDLAARGETVDDMPPPNAPRQPALDLDALMNPEGAILVVDPQSAPYVLRFEDLSDYLAWHAGAEPKPLVATITGVGSSALGSAAFAWDVAVAEGAPVIAIVPGYGLADALEQALGGFFGFGLYDALHAKAHIQAALAVTAPKLAMLGHRLAASTRTTLRAVTGAPVFQTGSGASDVLHALMSEIKLARLVGHSKGALQIANAIRSLDASRTEGLEVTTFGCAIPEELAGVAYRQFLGVFDPIGQLNSWGNAPEAWERADHSTNRALPLSMDVVRLAESGAAATA
jgi:hypothetical protein